MWNTHFVLFMVTYFDVGVVLFVIPLLIQPLITGIRDMLLLFLKQVPQILLMWNINHF